MLFLTKVSVPERQLVRLGGLEYSFLKSIVESNCKILNYSQSNSLIIRSQNQKVNFLNSDLDKQLY
jgi:hypothetical protein